VTRRSRYGAGSEHAEQVAIFQWAQFATAIYPPLKLLFAIPNGANVGARAGAMLNAEGRKRGAPDICLPVARGGYHGLFIELKKDATKKPSPEQRWWLDALHEQGYLALLCVGQREAVDSIEAYIKGELTREGA